MGSAKHEFSRAGGYASFDHCPRAEGYTQTCIEQQSGSTAGAPSQSCKNTTTPAGRSRTLSPSQSSVPIVGRHMGLDYYDYADVPEELQEIPAEERNTGGVQSPFPERLHDMLAQSDNGQGFAQVVSWSSHGRCFVVRQPKDFEATILPQYFNQTKYRSFQRQLNLYGFKRITGGMDRGGYYHPLLLRNRRKLCTRMRRTKSANKGGAAGAAAACSGSPSSITVNTNALIDADMEPNFYAMPSVGLVPNAECAAYAVQSVAAPAVKEEPETQESQPPAPAPTATFQFNLTQASPLTAALFS